MDMPKRIENVVQLHPLLGRETRIGSWAEQAISTVRLIEQAVDGNRLDDAAALARYTLQELAELHLLYPDFMKQARRWLVDHGVSEEDLAAEEARLSALVRLPDASAPDLTQAWNAYEAAVDTFVMACTRGGVMPAMKALRIALEQWRLNHDRACDLLYGMTDICARHLGEARVADLWKAMMGEFIDTRDRYDLDATPWERSFPALMLDTAETFRGHLSGPARNGDLEIHEEKDRWVFSFAPCGTGGRTLTGNENTGPLMEPPYDFGVTTQEQSWAWNLKGVCFYCAHCCILQERVPIEKYGYPLRVVEPPTWPQSRGSGRCTWNVYKDPSLVPEEAYRRVGHSKPDRLGSIARTEQAASRPSESDDHLNSTPGTT